jgi:hypothetical protein
MVELPGRVLEVLDVVSAYIKQSYAIVRPIESEFGFQHGLLVLY